MVSPKLRASAYGPFTAGYGIFWFIGSALIGFLYDRSISAVVAFCIVAELAAIPCFISAQRQTVTRGRRTQWQARCWISIP
jgi:hypothetical protein